MNKQEIFEFMNKYPACYLATTDGDTPRVRGMLMYRADEKGIIFNTGIAKDLFKQLQKNPKVELCFVNNSNLQDFIQVRVSGVATMENDMKIKEELLTNRPFLKPIVEKYGYDVIAVFSVQKLTATIWTMATNLEPKEFIKLT
jgi:pyridoxamine 5'-phosphate oxidase